MVLNKHNYFTGKHSIYFTELDHMSTATLTIEVIDTPLWLAISTLLVISECYPPITRVCRA